MKPALLAASLLVILSTAAHGLDAREFKRRFQETPDSWERRALILQLDPNDSASLTLLTRSLLRSKDWYMRQAALEALARLRDPVGLIRLEREKNVASLEGIILAFGHSKQADRIPFIAEQLAHKKWKIRRASALALRRRPDKRAVDPLITCWEKEKDFRVWIHVLESLETITGEKDLRRARDWRSWWESVKDTWQVPGDGKQRQKSGERIRTRVRGTNIDLHSRGRGMPLLVLPEYGYEQNYLQTYLRDLEDTNQILYMKLPGATDFTDPKLQPAPDLPDPYYPLERIVDALEALHKQLVAEKKIRDKPFALMAHGLTCWIAMTYAARHPKRVRRMILIAPYSGGAAWDKGRERVVALGQKLGDKEMEHFAQNQLYDGYKTRGAEEDDALERKEFTLYFANQGDLEIGRLWGPVIEKEDGEAHVIQRLMGTVVIPEFELTKTRRVQIPTLIVHGDRSVRTSLADAQAIAKFYGKAQVVRFKKSARMPFIEEHDLFRKMARKFLKKR